MALRTSCSEPDLVDYESPTLVFQAGVGGIVNAKAQSTQAPIPVASTQIKTEADEFAELFLLDEGQ